MESDLEQRSKNERVVVSGHATDRARERIPGVPEEKLVGLIYSEVIRALAAGRTAKTIPRWIAGDGHRYKVPARKGTHRFVWPEHQRYAYLLGTFRANDGRRSWIVKTVMERRG